LRNLRRSLAGWPRNPLLLYRRSPRQRRHRPAPLLPSCNSLRLVWQRYVRVSTCSQRNSQPVSSRWGATSPSCGRTSRRFCASSRPLRRGLTPHRRRNRRPWRHRCLRHLRRKRGNLARSSRGVLCGLLTLCSLRSLDTQRQQRNDGDLSGQHCNHDGIQQKRAETLATSGIRLISTQLA
jgi:hypothetical protein